MNGLSGKAEAFAQRVASGDAYAKAYRNAYNSKGGPHTVAVEGSRLVRMPKVAARIAELRQETARAAGMSRIEKRVYLAAIICGDVEARPEARIAAIALDNRMTGEDEPLKPHLVGRVVFTVDPCRIGKGERPSTETPEAPPTPFSNDNASIEGRENFLQK